MDDGFVRRWLDLTRKQKEIEDKLAERLLENNGIALNEYYILYFLDKADGRSMRLNDLGKAVGLSQSAMSRTVSRMENRSCGLVTRRSCAKDKRGIYIALTDKGRNTLKDEERAVKEVLRGYFASEE